MADKIDLYQRVTISVVAELEKGVRPWAKPWNGQNAAGRITLPRRSNGVPYRGMNILLLWSVMMERGYASPFWLTYKQAQALGGQVRRGERGSPVVFAGRFSKTETDSNGDAVERSIPYLKPYTVFSAEQVDGLPPHFYARETQPRPEVERIAEAEAYFANIPAKVMHGGNDAMFIGGLDLIRMPVIEAFRCPEHYYTTRLHETAHWSRVKSRLDRDFGRKRWGDEGYAMEEVVAELSAAFWGAAMGMEPLTREDHNNYIGHWIKVLKNDHRAIFSAAAHAQRVMDYLDGMQPGHLAEDDADGLAEARAA